MDQDWAVIRNCSSLIEAGFLKSLLEPEGIDVEIPDEFAIGVNPGYTNMLGGIRVMVHTDQLRLANEVLEASTPSASADE
jgi:hypothetical protein